MAVKCRLIKECALCILKGCLWTNLATFPCRSNPNETDGKIVKECRLTNGSLSITSAQSPEDATTTVHETVHFFSMFVIFIGIMAIWCLGIRTVLERSLRYTSEWIQMRTLKREDEKLLVDRA